jgi:DNA-binding CsgD family transcriptional regulator
MHLDSHSLRLAHRFALQLHASTDLTLLRSLIPSGLSRLMACDRASVNELNLSENGRAVMPAPIPGWWARFGEAYQAHVTDHPVFRNGRVAKLLRTVSLDDVGYGAQWRKSALNHEYFVPLGVKHQLSALISLNGDDYMCIAINRGRKEFTVRERALLDLVNPHVARAWQNAALVAELRRQAEQNSPRSRNARGVVSVSVARRRVRALTSEASRMLQKYFSTDTAGCGRLPDELNRWLQAERAKLTARDALPSPAQPLCVRRPGANLIVKLARIDPDETVLLFDEIEESATGDQLALDGLTPRENEILGWITEGKRNPEIAVILDVSSRTVEKHVEHILVKLGVETRGAAIRAAFERQRSPHARTHHG